MQKVELRLAFTYICEECGKANFVNGILEEWTEEEMEDFRKQKELATEDEWVEEERYL